MTLILMRTSSQILLRTTNHRTSGGVSDLIYFDFMGAQLWDTQNPQSEIDYECGTHRLKVIGVDLT